MLTSDEYDSSDNESKNDMHIKKFTLSSYNIFSNYINEKKTKKNEISPLLNTSILLREMLRTLLTDIDTVAESTQLAAELAGSGDQTDSPEIQQLILSYDLVKNLERTWHVCEVLFLNSHENTFILEFIHWLKVSFTSCFLLCFLS